MPLRKDLTDFLHKNSHLKEIDDKLIAEESALNKLIVRKLTGDLNPEDIDELNSQKAKISALNGEIIALGEQLEELENSIKDQLEVVDLAQVQIKVPEYGYFVFSVINDELHFDTA